MKNQNSIKSKRSQVLTLAHGLVKEGYTFAAAQRKAWHIIRLKEIMQNNVVRLFYKKANGESAERIATLSAAYLPERKQRTGAPRKRTSIKVTYWEVESNCFKSFLPQNLKFYQVVKAVPVALPKSTGIAA